MGFFLYGVQTGQCISLPRSGLWIVEYGNGCFSGIMSIVGAHVSVWGSQVTVALENG